MLTGTNLQYKLVFQCISIPFEDKDIQARSKYT